MTCERCGSINVVRARASNFERVLRFLTGKKKFFCRRCGWTALRAWDERDLHTWKERSAVHRKMLKEQDEFDIDRFH